MTYWRGIHKVQEEMAELGAVLGKLCVVPVGKHWDEEPHAGGREVGAPPLRERLIDEAGDVYAALEYLLIHNLTLEERQRILHRHQFKAQRFERWGLSGISDGDKDP